MTELEKKQSGVTPTITRKKGFLETLPLLWLLNPGCQDYHLCATKSNPQRRGRKRTPPFLLLAPESTKPSVGTGLWGSGLWRCPVPWLQRLLGTLISVIANVYPGRWAPKTVKTHKVGELQIKKGVSDIARPNKMVDVTIVALVEN